MFSQVMVWCSLSSGGIPEKPRRVTAVLACTRTCTRFVSFIIFPGFWTPASLHESDYF